jgi:hypothetical protein
LTAVSAIAFSPQGNLILCNGGPGNGVCIWDLSLPFRIRESADAAFHAREAMENNRSDDRAAASLVEWYAERGMLEWARLLLDEGHLDGRAGLIAAQVRFQLHDDAIASLDFKSLIERADSNAPPLEYLNACCSAAIAAQTTSPVH